jgi:hypothetical protein
MVKRGKRGRMIKDPISLGPSDAVEPLVDPVEWV